MKQASLRNFFQIKKSPDDASDAGPGKQQRKEDMVSAEIAKKLALVRPAKRQKITKKDTVTVEINRYEDIQNLLAKPNKDVVDRILDFNTKYPEDITTTKKKKKLDIDKEIEFMDKYSCKDCKGQTEILDFRKFTKLGSILIKEKTGNVRVKELGGEPQAENRLQLVFPKKRDLKITFWWVGYTRSNRYDCLTEALRTTLHGSFQVEEWARDESMTTKKLFTPVEMEEKKWEYRFQSLKGKSTECLPALNDLPVETGTFEEKEMVLCFKVKLIDGTLEFRVLEVANAAVHRASKELGPCPPKESKLVCPDDQECNWMKKWSETHPEESACYEKIHCFETPSGSSIASSVPRNLIFRTLPAVSEYLMDQPELRVSSYRDHQLGLIAHLKPEESGTIKCPECGDCFDDVEGFSAHVKLQMKDRQYPCGRLYFKYNAPVMDPTGRFLSAGHVKGTGWEQPVKKLLEGKSARSESSRPKTKSEYRAWHAKFKKEVELRYECVGQVEYYLSAINLRSDTFYRPKISAGKDGWFHMSHIMTAPRIKAKSISMEDLAIALLIESESAEVQKKDSGDYLIRRKGGKKLPVFKAQSRYSNYRRHRSGYDDYSDYGFDGGCMGYSGRDCDMLLDCGVKPWDDDAGYVLGALY